MANETHGIEISGEVARALQGDTGVEVVQKWFIQPKTKRAYTRKTETTRSVVKAVSPTGNSRVITITDKESALYRMRVKGNSYTNSKRNIALALVDRLQKTPSTKPLTLGHFRDMLTTALQKSGHNISKNTTIDLAYWLKTNCIINIPFTRIYSRR